MFPLLFYIVIRKIINENWIRIKDKMSMFLMRSGVKEDGTGIEKYILITYWADG